MHDLKLFAENLFIVDGPRVRDTGVWFTTRMTVVRLSDGSLWVNSPVPVSFETLKRITELGPIRYLIAGTPRHVWRLDAWHTLFPEAELWATRNTPMTLKRRSMPPTRVLRDAPAEGWAHDLDQLAFKGNPLAEEILFFHKASRTVILDDLIQIHIPDQGKPFLNAIIKLGGVGYPQGGVPRDIRLTFINRGAARKSLERLLSWDFDKLIIAHGPCAENGAKALVERAFKWLR